jgi:hypothetical protein
VARSSVDHFESAVEIHPGKHALGFADLIRVNCRDIERVVPRNRLDMQ